MAKIAITRDMVENRSMPVPECEEYHISDILSGLADGKVNKVFQTEGFASEADWQSSREQIQRRLAAYRGAVLAGTTRRDIGR
ncbi:hypothetical protein KRR26_09525 [Corallococcus sp. M34]|uniref:hypothetical protein n=1 Tax=Citreicoccus inhibens TaxID=2849499 RepID=UPI001C22F985|nr:hypothetical protein [Citreicoccus inhibens]MBU8895845.1 hypothetical protein [Citreicoccus inhibens]